MSLQKPKEVYAARTVNGNTLRSMSRSSRTLRRYSLVTKGKTMKLFCVSFIGL